MRRRRFVSGLLSISALVLGLPALRAQQPSRMPERVAVLMLYAEDDSRGKPALAPFAKALPATILARADEVLE